MTLRPLGRPRPRSPIRLAQRERIWRLAVIGGAAATLILVTGLVAYAVYDQQVLQPRRTVAVVEGQPILAGEFLGRYRLRLLELQNQLNSTQQTLALFAADPQFESFLQEQIRQISAQLGTPLLLGQQVLDELIEDALVEQELASLGANVLEEDVDREIELGFGFSETMTPTASATARPTAPASGTTTPSPTPRPSATPYTREAFEADYAANLRNLAGLRIDEQDYRARVRAQVARRKLHEVREADVPRDEEQVWARHILLGDERTALALLDQLLAGHNWGDLATRYSLDTATRARQGDLGWFPRGQMDTKFEERTFAAEAGAVVGPFRTPFGWHLVEILGHEVHPLDDALYSRRVDAAVDDWLVRRRSEADIQVDGSWVEAVGRAG